MNEGRWRRRRKVELSRVSAGERARGEGIKINFCGFYWSAQCSAHLLSWASRAAKLPLEGLNECWNLRLWRWYSLLLEHWTLERKRRRIKLSHSRKMFVDKKKKLLLQQLSQVINISKISLIQPGRSNNSTKTRRRSIINFTHILSSCCCCLVSLSASPSAAGTFCRSRSKRN